MTLSPDRLDRFARHIVLPELGGAGQVALSKAHVVLVGCGGIGSPVLQYLAGAGIGRLTLIDDDAVDLTNLQRQTIFAEADIGLGKDRLALKVGEIDRIVIDQRQPTNSGPREILQHGRADPATTDQHHVRLAERDLAGPAQFGQHDMTGKAVKAVRR